MSGSRIRQVLATQLALFSFVGLSQSALAIGFPSEAVSPLLASFIRTTPEGTAIARELDGLSGSFGEAARTQVAERLQSIQRSLLTFRQLRSQGVTDEATLITERETSEILNGELTQAERLFLREMASRELQLSRAWRRSGRRRCRRASRGRTHQEW